MLSIEPEVAGDCGEGSGAGETTSKAMRRCAASREAIAASGGNHEVDLRAVTGGALVYCGWCALAASSLKMVGGEGTSAAPTSENFYRPQFDEFFTIDGIVGTINAVATIDVSVKDHSEVSRGLEDDDFA
ncbi:hypothetical protein U1Q18_045152 [Sarracenia purpurea var. burkii]